MDYKLLKEDEKSYHLKDAKGKDIKIAKQALTDALHKKIRAFASGGMVEEPDSGSDFSFPSGKMDPMFTPAEAPQEPIQTLSAEDAKPAPFEPQNFGEKLAYGFGMAAQPFVEPTLNMGRGPNEPRIKWEDKVTSHIESRRNPFSVNYGAGDLAGGDSPAAIGSAIAGKEPVQMDIPVGGEVTQGAGSGNQDPLIPPPQQQPQQSKSLDQMLAANQMQSQAAQKYYNEAKSAQDEAQIKQMEIHNTWAKNRSVIDREQNDLMRSISENKIDPNRLWNSKDTGGKISTSIALILGGLGSGLTGGPNQALQTLNRLVDQDIDAQKAELGKKQSLYSMNLQKYRDADSAYLATKAQSAAMVQGRLASAAAMMGTEQAKASALQAAAQINQVREQYNQQLSQRATMKQIMDFTKQTGNLDYVDYLPEKEAQVIRERAVPGFGLASTKETAAKANEIVSNTRAGVSLLNELKAYADKSGAKLSPTESARAETLARMVMGQIREGVLGPGTVNEGERKILEKMVANPTNLTQLPSTAKKSLQTLIDTLEDKQRITLTQYGLKPPAKLQKGAPVR